MLKTRIIPTLLYKNLRLVKGIGFDSWRCVGSPMQAIKVYNLREVDELIFLDITATLDNRRPDFDLIDDLADDCFMPMAVGGGIRSNEDVRRLLQVGADKVCLNTGAVDNPGLVSEIASEFGSQCLVVSIDYKKINDTQYEVYTHSGSKPTGLCPLEMARQAEMNGAGEILLTSIDRDGTMSGYDIELTESVSQALSIPVICSGGAGNFGHMLDILTQTKASAVAAASIFHFTQQTPLEAKRFLFDHGIATRC